MAAAGWFAVVLNAAIQLRFGLSKPLADAARLTAVLAACEQRSLGYSEAYTREALSKGRRKTFLRGYSRKAWWGDGAGTGAAIQGAAEGMQGCEAVGAGKQLWLMRDSWPGQAVKGGTRQYASAGARNKSNMTARLFLGGGCCSDKRGTVAQKEGPRLQTGYTGGQGGEQGTRKGRGGKGFSFRQVDAFGRVPGGPKVKQALLGTRGAWAGDRIKAQPWGGVSATPSSDQRLGGNKRPESKCCAAANIPAGSHGRLQRLRRRHGRLNGAGSRRRQWRASEGGGPCMGPPIRPPHAAAWPPAAAP